jgi:antitoxin (DNA-binding transcriptional repressor) of toxin-antitoxin stability system
MLQIGAFEAKNTLGSLLDRVERGEEVLITRHGKPVAQLVRPVLAPNAADVDAAFASIRARTKALKMEPLGWEEYKKWRDEGRP